jgi:VanZ family protein
MGAILVLSTDLGSVEHTGRLLIPLLRSLWPGVSPLQIEALHGLTRNTAHVTEYALLAALWFRTLARGPGWPPGWAAAASLASSAGWAVVDETHQAFILSRTGSPGDVALDMLGAAAAAAVAPWGWRRAVDIATGMLLWTAAVGGALTIALDLGVGVRAGWLWVTVPVAAVTLFVRHLRGPAGR